MAGLEAINRFHEGVRVQKQNRLDIFKQEVTLLVQLQKDAKELLGNKNATKEEMRALVLQINGHLERCEERLDDVEAIDDDGSG